MCIRDRFKALPDDSSGQESLNTGRFLWQSNNDEVDETIFSGRCSQLNGVTCSTCSSPGNIHDYRFAYPYLPECGSSCNSDDCGNSIFEGNGDKLSRGKLATRRNYGGRDHAENGRFKGHADFPLAIIAPLVGEHHASRLQIYAP